MPVHVLLDAAIGDNIDDSIALALACASPEIDLVGVTTVGSESYVRAAIAERIMAGYGCQQIPVVPGHTPSNLRPPGKMKLVGDGVQLSIPEPNDHSPQVVEDFMAEQIRAHPGLTLVATGPLTNIAALIRAHPDVIPKVGRLVFMGGWASQGLPEPNIRRDPAAARVVLESSLPLTMVGYEVTLGCALRQEHLARFGAAQTPGASYLRTLLHTWRHVEKDPHPIMHDPLTIALLCQPTLVETTTLRVTVEHDAGGAPGLIRTVEEEGREVSVCTSVAARAYLDFLMDRVAPAPGHALSTRFDPHAVSFVIREAYQAKHFPGWTNVHRPSQHILVLVTEGTCTLTVDQTLHHIEANSILYFDAEHTYRIESPGGMASVWLHFDCFEVGMARELSRRTAPLPGFELCLKVPEDVMFQLLTYTERLLEHWCKPRPESGFMCASSLLELIGRIYSFSHDRAMEQGSPNQIVMAKAKAYIESRVNQSLHMDALGQYVGMSKHHLARTFKEHYGVTPMQYHQHLRMEQAKRLLRTGNLTVKAVALQLGYGSIYSFSRAFHREVGVPPSEFGASMD